MRNWTQGLIIIFQIIFYMITLALVTPLGVVIGMIVTEYTAGQSGTQIMVMGLLQGLAGGTLLYITFYEVLEREKLEKMGMDGLAGCFLLILGFSIMAGLEAAGKVKVFWALNISVWPFGTFFFKELIHMESLIRYIMTITIIINNIYMTI